MHRSGQPLIVGRQRAAAAVPVQVFDPVPTVLSDINIHAASADGLASGRGVKVGKTARTSPSAQRRFSPRLTGPVGARALARRALGPAEGSSPQVVAARDAALQRLLLLADMTAVALALLLAVHVAGDGHLSPVGLLLVPGVTLAGRLMALHDRDQMVLSKTTLNEAPRLFHLATLATLVTVLGQDVLVEGSLMAFQGVVLWTSFLGGSLLCRAAVRRAGIRNSTSERCLIIGDADSAERIRERLASDPTTNAEVVARVSVQELLEPADAGEALSALIEAVEVQRVVLDTPDLDSERMIAILRHVKSLGVKVTLKPRLLDVVGTAVEFDDVRGTVFLGVRRFGLTRFERRTKRVVDLAGALALLLAMAPLFAACAAAIKLTSKGPVFFRQVRVGRDGGRFRIWKFRTMVEDAESQKASLRVLNECTDGLFKIERDPRVTRVGRFLRRTALDELPQLLNVVSGEMSLVGPRPLVVEEDERIVGRHRERLHLTPGMTGVWQVLGSSRVPLAEMVALDYMYIVNWSIWKDVQILLRTVPFVLSRRGQ